MTTSAQGRANRNRGARAELQVVKYLRANGGDKLEARFWSKVDRSDHDGCWTWMAALDPKGYGRFFYDGRTNVAHRYAYTVAVGIIPPGLQIDHLCRNTSCVNPDHLEAVTSAENSRRGLIAEVTRQRHASIEQCPAGHPYDDDNTYRKPGDPRRHCRACSRLRRNGVTAAHLCRSCGMRHVGVRYPKGVLVPAVDGVVHRCHEGQRLCELPEASRRRWAA